MLPSERPDAQGVELGEHVAHEEHAGPGEVQEDAEHLRVPLRGHGLGRGVRVDPDEEPDPHGGDDLPEGCPVQSRAGHFLIEGVDVPEVCGVHAQEDRDARDQAEGMEDLPCGRLGVVRHLADSGRPVTVAALVGDVVSLVLQQALVVDVADARNEGEGEQAGAGPEGKQARGPESLGNVHREFRDIQHIGTRWRWSQEGPLLRAIRACHGTAPAIMYDQRLCCVLGP
mmetsp:Transcript_51035/g.143643  ORF Transcript_51035/g.143643 Transcript_51035/m.143643 type:complete len:228 (+) Transcript_51035:578-1261(+)